MLWWSASAAVVSLHVHNGPSVGQKWFLSSFLFFTICRVFRAGLKHPRNLEGKGKENFLQNIWRMDRAKADICFNHARLQRDFFPFPFKTNARHHSKAGQSPLCLHSCHFLMGMEWRNAMWRVPAMPPQEVSIGCFPLAHILQWFWNNTTWCFKVEEIEENPLPPHIPKVSSVPVQIFKRKLFPLLPVRDSKNVASCFCMCDTLWKQRWILA